MKCLFFSFAFADCRQTPCRYVFVRTITQALHVWRPAGIKLNKAQSRHRPAVGRHDEEPQHREWEGAPAPGQYLPADSRRLQGRYLTLQSRYLLTISIKGAIPLINNVLGATSKLQEDMKVVSLSFSNVLIALGNLSTHAVSSQGR